MIAETETATVKDSLEDRFHQHRRIAEARQADADEIAELERIELNEELFSDYMSKPELQDVVSKWLGSQVYDRLGGSKDSGVYPRT